MPGPSARNRGHGKPSVSSRVGRPAGRHVEQGDARVAVVAEGEQRPVAGEDLGVQVGRVRPRRPRRRGRPPPGLAGLQVAQVDRPVGVDDRAGPAGRADRDTVARPPPQHPAAGQVPHEHRPAGRLAADAGVGRDRQGDDPLAGVGVEPAAVAERAGPVQPAPLPPAELDRGGGQLVGEPRAVARPQGDGRRVDRRPRSFSSARMTIQSSSPRTAWPSRLGSVPRLVATAAAVSPRPDSLVLGRSGSTSRIIDPAQVPIRIRHSEPSHHAPGGRASSWPPLRRSGRLWPDVPPASPAVQIRRSAQLTG